MIYSFFYVRVSNADPMSRPVLARSDNDGYESDFLVLGLSPEVHQSICGSNIIPKEEASVLDPNKGAEVLDIWRSET
jgi:hypothetical protein